MDIAAMFRLDGRVACVTGGEQGIGFAIATAFAQAGADIVIAGISEVRAVEAQKAIEALGRRFLFIRTDVTREADVAGMVRQSQKVFGRMDILCNNAGISRHAETAEMSLEMWQRVIETNLTSQFLVSREVGKIMLQQGKGSIVNIASISGLIVNTPIAQCNYNASKAGVIQLTKSLACEWAQKGIRVNAIAPGYIRTPITEHRFSNPLDPNVAVWRSMTPMGREGYPEEIAGAAVYLASDAASYTTACVLTVDGGYTAW